MKLRKSIQRALSCLLALTLLFTAIPVCASDGMSAAETEGAEVEPGAGSGAKAVPSARRAARAVNIDEPDDIDTLPAPPEAEVSMYDGKYAVWATNGGIPDVTLKRGITYHVRVECYGSYGTVTARDAAVLSAELKNTDQIYSARWAYDVLCTPESVGETVLVASDSNGNVAEICNVNVVPYFNTDEYDENGYPVFEFVYGESYGASDLVVGATNSMYTTIAPGYASSEEYSWFGYVNDAASNGYYRVGSTWLNSGNSVPYTVSGLQYSSSSVGEFYMTVRIVGTDPTISFANSSVTKTVGDAAFTNTVTTTSDGTKTYSSSSTNVATVDSTGKVTIKGAGTATITCSVAASSTYNAASASYTLTVNKAKPDLKIKETGETYSRGHEEYPLYTWAYGESHSLEEVLSVGSKYDGILNIKISGSDAPDYSCFDGNGTDCLTVTDITSIGTYNGEEGIALVQVSCPETDNYTFALSSFWVRLVKATPELKIKETGETYTGNSPVGELPLYTWAYGESHSIDEVLSEESKYDGNLVMGGVDAPDTVCFDGNGSYCLTVSNVSISDYNGEDGIALVEIISHETTNYSMGHAYFYVRLEKATPNLKLKETGETGTIRKDENDIEIPVFRLVKGETYTAKDFLDLDRSDFDENADLLIFASFGVDQELLGINGITGDEESVIPQMTGESLDHIYVWCSETDTYKRGESGLLKIIVENPKPQLSFAEDSVTKTYGDEKFTNTLITDSDGDVTYVSSNTDVAEIDETTGEVTIVGAGTAVISATVGETENYSSATVDYALTVNKAENIIQFAESSITKSYGTTDFVNPLLCKVVNHGKITYTSSDNSIATVSEDGTVSVVGVGRVTITAVCAESSNNTKSTCSYELIVTKQELAAPKVTGVAETIKGKRDGRIEGLSTDMEYSTDGINYTKVTDASMLFAPGSYYVQYSVTDTAEPFGRAEVVIEEGRMLTVTFKADGSDDTVLETTYGGSVTAPSVPEREGYDSSGWDVTNLTNITSDLTVNAVYTKKVYTVTFKADGAVVATKSVEHGSTLTDIPSVPSKEGYNQVAPVWDTTDFTNITANLTVNAVYTKNEYTVDLSASVTAPDGTTVEAVTDTDVEYGDTFTFTVDVEEGYSKIDDFSVKVNGEEVTPNDDGSYTVTVTGDISIEVTGVADITSPEVSITVKDNIWKKFLNTISFNLFFNEKQDVVIAASDLGSGVNTIQYYLANEGMSLDDVRAITGWSDYNSSFSISPDNRYVIYSKVTDNAGNTTYVSSDGILLNSTAPDISGIENGGIYYGDTKFIVDTPYIGKVTVDGVEVELADDGSYTIKADNATHEVSAEDLFGNVTAYTISVCEMHMVTFKADGKLVAEKSVGHGLALTDVPVIPVKEGYNQVVPVWSVTDFSNITSDLTVNAIYTKNVYTVTFKADGTVVATKTVEYGGALTDLPEIPAKEGYDQTAPTWDVTDFSNITSDITVNAVYTINVYTVTFKADGSAVAEKVVEWGSTLTDIPEIPAKTGYDQTTPTWDISDFSNIKTDLTVNAVYVKNTYDVGDNGSITVPDGASVNPKGDTDVEYGDTFTFTVDIDDGYSKTDGFKVLVNGEEVYPDEEGENTYSVVVTGDISIVVEGIADITSPEVEIKVSDNTWKSLLNKITFNVFFKDTQEVVITGTDLGSGVKEVKYYLASEPVSGSEVSSITGWVDYVNPVYISPNNQYIIYARVTDNAGNATIISSDGIVLNNVAPTIPGVEDGGVYYGDVEFTVEATALASVIIDGAEEELSEDGYIVPADNLKHTISLEDASGNTTTYTITVYKNYTVVFKADGSVVAEKTVGYGNALSDIPAVPAKEGYNQTDPVWDVTDFSSIKSNLTVNAVYTKNVYTVTFKADGEIVSTKTVGWGDTLTDVPSIPAKEGYDQVAPVWNRTDFSNITSDLVVEAVYTKNVYTVTFMADDIVVTTKTVGHGDALVDVPPVPAKEGYVQTAPVWDVTDFSSITGDLIVNAVYTKDSYSIDVTAPEGSGYEIRPVSYTDVEYGDEFSFTLVSAGDEYSTEDAVVKINGVAVEPNNDGVYTVTVTGELTIEVTGVRDVVAPVVKVTVGKNSWEKFLDAITFGLFFSDDEYATVETTDGGSGIERVEYFVTQEALSLEDVKAITQWTEYGGRFILSPNGNYVVYARAEDREGNVTYVSSDGLVFDNVAPVVTGIEDGKIYYGDITVTIGDDVSKLLVDGGEAEVADGKHVIAADNAEHTVVVVDAAGNETKYTVIVYQNHKVTFMVDGKVFSEIIIKHGEGVESVPAIPVKEGYTDVEPVWDVSDLGNITEDLTVNAVYTLNEVDVSFGDGGDTDSGCTILPTDSNGLHYGEDYTFNVEIKPGYEKTDGFAVLVNGEEIEPNADGSYTVKNVTGNLNIDVKGIRKLETTKDDESGSIKDGDTVATGNYHYKILSTKKMTCQVTGIKNTSITNITVYNSVTFNGVNYKVVSVKANAFKGYNKATSVAIGRNVKVIGKYAFKNCKNIKKVTVKSLGLRRIKAGAFSGCRKLKSVVIKSKNLKAVGKNAFKNISKKAVISVPARKYVKYIKILSGKGTGMLKGTGVK